MKKRPSSTQVIAVGLFLLACILGVLSNQQSQPQPKIPRARYNDAAPLGGKGLRLMAERLNYKTRLESGVVNSTPKDARLWFLLDPMAYFSLRESKELLAWVEEGGTLVWAMSPASVTQSEEVNKSAIGIQHLKRAIGISAVQIDSKLYEHSTDPLPPLTPLEQNIVSPLWSGVADAQGSAGGRYNQPPPPTSGSNNKPHAVGTNSLWQRPRIRHSRCPVIHQLCTIQTRYRCAGFQYPSAACPRA